jgi:hypothetical protein
MASSRFFSQSYDLSLSHFSFTIKFTSIFYIQGYNIITLMHIIVTNNKIKDFCHRNLQSAEEMLCASTVYVVPVLSSFILMLEEPEIRKERQVRHEPDYNAIQTTATILCHCFRSFKGKGSFYDSELTVVVRPSDDLVLQVIYK